MVRFWIRIAMMYRERLALGGVFSGFCGVQTAKGRDAAFRKSVITALGFLRMILEGNSVIQCLGGQLRSSTQWLQLRGRG